MSRLISLSRAARLVGVKRATLQKRIRGGEIRTFEGQLDLSELLRAYPDTNVDDSAMIERSDAIIERALNKVVRDRDSLPDPEVLATRLAALSYELETANARVRRYETLYQELLEKLSMLSPGAPEDSGLDALKSWVSEAWQGLNKPVAFSEELSATDALLRIMAAHVYLQPSGHDYFLQGRDTLLEAGLHAGFALDYGCSDGSCGKCKARLVSGTVKPVKSFAGNLSDSERQNGYILTCGATAVTDVTLEMPEVAAPAQLSVDSLEAVVSRVDKSREECTIIFVKTAGNKRLRFVAGQHVRIGLHGPAEGEYPISSCQCEQTSMEFHVFTDTGNSSLAHALQQLKPGDILKVEGPMGDFTLDAGSIRPVIFIAWDQGFAHIKGIVEHAMALDVAESLHLFWIKTGPGKPYMHNRCRSWGDALDNFHYHMINIELAERDVERIRSANTVISDIAEKYFDVSAFDFYIAAPAAIVTEWEQNLAARGLPRAQVKTKII